MKQVKRMIYLLLIFIISLTSTIIITSFDVYAANTANKAKVNKSATYVAKVGNDEITKEEYNLYLKGAERAIQSSYGSSTMDWTTKIENITAAEFAKKLALDNIVSIKILLNKAKAAKISMTKKEIDDLNANLDQAIKNLGKTASEQEKALKAETGVSIAQYKTFCINDALSQKFATYIRNNYKFTDEELKKYYNINKDELYKVSVSHILFLTTDAANQQLPQDKQDLAKKNAEETLEKVNLPNADFAALAKQYSEDPGSKDNGGEYTVIKNHQFVPEFENWATDPIRKAGDTGIIKTSYGYHIMKINKIFAFDEIKNDIKNSISSLKYSDDLTAWKKDIKYKVVMNPSVFNAIKVPI